MGSPVRIDETVCLRCQRCMKVCPTGHLEKVGEKIVPVENDISRPCILCGLCMMTCSGRAISVEGLSHDDIHDLPLNLPKFDDVLPLLKSRRSIRNFTPKEIDRETWEKVIDAASTAPMGIPPGNVELTVVNGRRKLNELVPMVIDELKKWDYAFKNPLITGGMRIAGQGNMVHYMLREVIPLVKGIINEDKEGRNFLTYDAPGLIIFHASKSTSSHIEDCLIAMSVGMIGAESLGLGTCINGMIPPAVDHQPKIRKMLGIPDGNAVVCAILLGWPLIKFGRSIKRRFKSVSWVGMDPKREC